MADLKGNNPITADGDYDFSASGSLTDITISGTWGGGTVTMKRQNPNDTATYVDIPSGTYTADTTFVIRSAPQAGLRITLAGATTPSLNVGTGRAHD